MPATVKRRGSVGGGLSRDAAARLAQKWLAQRRQPAERGREPKGQVAETVRHEKEAVGRRDKKEAVRRAVELDAPRWGPSECQTSPECLRQYITSPDYAVYSAMLLDRIRELSGKWWEVPGGGSARRIGYMYNRVVVEVEDPAAAKSPFRTALESNAVVLGRRDDGKVFGFYLYENRRERPGLRVAAELDSNCDRECVEHLKRLISGAPGRVALREGPEADYKLYEYNFGDVKLYIFDYAGGSYIATEAVRTRDDKHIGSGIVYSPIIPAEELAHYMKPFVESLSSAVGKKRAEQVLKTALEDLFNLPEYQSVKDWLQTAKKALKLAFNRKFTLASP